MAHIVPAAFFVSFYDQRLSSIMPIMNFRFAIIYAFLTAIILSAPAQADIVNEMFRVECIPELNVLTIGDYSANGALPEQALKNQSAEIGKKYGIYPYEGNIVTFDDNYSIQSPETFETECALKVEDNPETNKIVTYKIKLTGYFENSNPGGRCGGWRSFQASISNGKDVILDNIPFSLSCNSDSGITELKFLPHEGYAAIAGTNVKNIVWLDKSPIRPCDIYITSPDDPLSCPSNP